MTSLDSYTKEDQDVIKEPDKYFLARPPDRDGIPVEIQQY